MKRKLMALVAAATFVLAAGSAFAEHVTTPVGTVGNDGGYAVVLDGNSGNPAVFGGYVGVNSTDSCIDASDSGGPYNDDGSANEDHTPGCFSG
ncbi:MAG: hypothetical protein ABR548_00500 [Actinomycetota bacterium]|nr:hypothetical protein [Actinomycetota bacterium]